VRNSEQEKLLQFQCALFKTHLASSADSFVYSSIKERDVVAKLENTEKPTVEEYVTFYCGLKAARVMQNVTERSSKQLTILQVRNQIKYLSELIQLGEILMYIRVIEDSMMLSTPIIEEMRQLRYVLLIGIDLLPAWELKMDERQPMGIMKKFYKNNRFQMEKAKLFVEEVRESSSEDDDEAARNLLHNMPV